MTEYIKRDDAKNAVHRHWLDSSRTLDAIMDIPAADVAPVVHGKLTHSTYDMRYCKHGTCNVCGAYIQSWNYCSNCGAKMDGEPHDNT